MSQKRKKYLEFKQTTEVTDYFSITINVAKEIPSYNEVNILPFWTI